MANRGFMRGVQEMFGQRGEGDASNTNNRDSNRTTNTASTNTASMDLDAMFQSIFGSIPGSGLDAATRAAMEASMQDQQQQQPKGPPPASERALKELPLIQIKTEDLVDPANRECSICLDAHALGDVALRLPCSHIYHRDCVLDWLRTNCTCPECRYELPTDDAAYERGRVERMRCRKPRYARHELERLTVRELKHLLPAPYQAVDRSDLVQHVIDCGCVDLVQAPEPVEYSMSALKQMSVSQLRRCMNEEAGVFFDPKDVVEKSDMIRIFQASGRLLLLPEDDDQSDDEECDKKPAATVSNGGAATSGLVVETVPASPETQQQDLRKDRTLVMEESSPQHPARKSVETAEKEDDVASTHGEQHDDEDGDEAKEAPLEHVSVESNESPPPSPDVIVLDMEVEDVHNQDEQNDSLGTDSVSIMDIDDDASHNHSDQENIPSIGAGDSHDSEGGADHGQQDQKRSADDVVSATTRFDNMSVSELRRAARELSVDLSGCVEKQDMIAALAQAEQSMVETLFDGLTPSELLMTAKLVGVDDLSGDLVSALKQEVTRRPQSLQFALSLKPFVRLSVSQLRAVARERGVNVQHCIEKTEILQTLVESS